MTSVRKCPGGSTEAFCLWINTAATQYIQDTPSLHSRLGFDESARSAPPGCEMEVNVLIQYLFPFAMCIKASAARETRRLKRVVML